MTPPEEQLREGDALVVVDVQPDFCPGGALAVPEGDRVVPILNAWIAAARKQGVPIYASRDWHPPGHVSFQEQGGEWPPHCVQDTPGAQYHPDLALPEDVLKISKGVRLDHDQYSVFDQTGAAEHMRKRNVRRLFVGGLAQDVCVRASVLDACREGFEVHLLADATRPVDAEKGRRAMDEMRDAGARIEPG